MSRLSRPTLADATATIDARPGLPMFDPAVHVSDNLIYRASLQKELRARGYRDLPDATNGGPRRWWPSRSRCAELARTATGEQRERLLRGMWL